MFTQRNNLWQTDEGVRRRLMQPELGQFVADVAGIDGRRIWHDQALIKEPYGSPTAFHLDVPYWSFTSADAITIRATFNGTQNVLPPAYFETLHVGDVLDNDEQNPLVFSRGTLTTVDADGGGH